MIRGHVTKLCHSPQTRNRIFVPRVRGRSTDVLPDRSYRFTWLSSRCACIENSTTPQIKRLSSIHNSALDPKVLNCSASQLRSKGLLSYEPPKSGVISYLPASWIPFAELMRLDKPAGTYYLFFPCLFSTLLAACYSASPISLIFKTSLLFCAGAFIMRGAGCTINDLWDRNLDPLVARTRYRPIARGAITPSAALTFTGIQCLTGLAVLLQFPTACLFFGVPSLLLVTIYPLAKRVTHYPQVILGLTFSWGAIMGFPALNVDLLADWPAALSAVCLYLSCVSWTVFYDMIYAHMDIKDDAAAGIKSIALKHEQQTKAVLSAAAMLQVALLAASGSVLDLGPLYFFGSCGSAAVTLGMAIWKVRLDDISSCWWWFAQGSWLTGGGIAGGLILEYALG